MRIDPLTIEPADGYKLLTNLVVPRPIAWVCSRDENGQINLAPFSFFNAVGSDPLMVIIGVGMNEVGRPKHTAENIARNGEFVVNLVTENLIDAMNLSAADFPDGESELLAAGLHTAESSRVPTPRIAEASAALECTLHSVQRIGRNNLILGQVVSIYVDDKYVGQRLHINGFEPIGRLGSPSMYCRTADRFDLPRMTYKQWQNSGGKPVESE